MSKLTYKIATASIAVMTIASLSAPAFAQTSASDLAAQIAALQAQLSQLQGGSSASSYNFTKNLTVGAKGEDVKQLQSILIAGGYLKVAAPTSYFGPATKAAVIAWQKAVGITPTSGYVGALSRAKLNGTVVSGGTVVTATDSYLKVEGVPSLGGNLPSSSLYNKVLNLKLTAGKDAVVVTGITATRGGYIANSRISGVSVWDEAGKRYGNIISSLTSDGKVTVNFGSDPMTVPAGTTKTLSVAINLDATSSSASLNFGVMAAADIKVSGTAPVQGTFPVIGGTFTIVDGSASLAQVQVSGETVAGTTENDAKTGTGNVSIGDMQKEVAKIKIAETGSKEAIQVKRLVLYVDGSMVETTDIKNFVLISQEGNTLATVEAAKDRYVAFNLATPYTIDKGMSRTFTVKADIKDGSGRYFNVYIQNDYDMVINGVSTGAAVLVKNSSNGTFTNTKDANSWFRMKAGDLTVSKAANSPSGSLAPSASNVVLGTFEVKSSGEQLELRKMKVYVLRSGANAQALSGTITVKDADSGEVYLSTSADAAAVQGTNSANATQQNLSTYIALASNQTRKLQVTGSIASNATSGSYVAKIGNFYGKRFSTNDYTDVGTTGLVDANSLSVKDVTLTVSKNTSVANVSLVTGAVDKKIASFNLKASDSDKIKINTVTLAVTTSSNIQNLSIKKGSTQLGSTIGTPANTSNSFSISGGLDIAKNETVTIDVYASIVSSAAGSSVVSMTGLSGYGVDSGKSLDAISTVTGHSVTIGSPTLTIAAVSNSADSKVLLSNVTGNSLGDFKFTATNDELKLGKVTYKVTATGTAATAAELAGTVKALKLYKSGVADPIATANVEVSGSDAVAVFNIGTDMQPTLTAAGTILTLKADTAGYDVIKHKVTFHAEIASTSTDNMEVFNSAGAKMDTGVSLSGTVASAYYKVVSAAPVIASVALTGARTPSSAEKVASFSVSAQGERPLTMTAITLKGSLAGALASSSVTTFELYDSTGQTKLATASGVLSAATTTNTFAFTSLSEEILAGNSKTYVVKANTTNVRLGSTSQTNTTLEVKFDGLTQYSSTGGNEAWAVSPITYSYDVIIAGSTTNYTGVTVSNTGDTSLSVGTYSN